MTHRIGEASNSLFHVNAFFVIFVPSIPNSDHYELNNRAFCYEDQDKVNVELDGHAQACMLVAHDSSSREAKQQMYFLQNGSCRILLSILPFIIKRCAL